MSSAGVSGYSFSAGQEIFGVGDVSQGCVEVNRVKKSIVLGGAKGFDEAHRDGGISVASDKARVAFGDRLDAERAEVD
eukprot:CAMPEP_0174884734 /NCGR_PEP_ID=MMETSP0167-20121228/164_1 /TAXON_ID=38298 /ORGANISM="Rhodella maculata, Strain CCMP736" /LENGTH=77 /DNA_ID=CAMNT_0016120169 /DNA_START=312 /DNA_END=545 /DNA_ORIENTATION=-